jgi:hypothetical protein
VKQVALNAILVSTFGLIGGANAQMSPAFSSYKSCPDRTMGGVWCPSQLSKEGWKLKYQSDNPRDLADLYWRYEVWAREQTVVLCALVGGRGGIRVNDCQVLNEVDR